MKSSGAATIGLLSLLLYATRLLSALVVATPFAGLGALLRREELTEKGGLYLLELARLERAFLADAARAGLVLLLVTFVLRAGVDAMIHRRLSLPRGGAHVGRLGHGWLLRFFGVTLLMKTVALGVALFALVLLFVIRSPQSAPNIGALAGVVALATLVWLTLATFFDALRLEVAAGARGRDALRAVGSLLRSSARRLVPLRALVSGGALLAGVGALNGALESSRGPLGALLGQALLLGAASLEIAFLARVTQALGSAERRAGPDGPSSSGQARASDGRSDERDGRTSP